jgi:nucleoside-diphosphate-sugar epimerase
VRVLVTGHRGMIGRAVHARLRAEGHEVIGLDRTRRDDVTKASAVARRARGCDVIVHAAALPNNRAGTPADIMRVNVLGTATVLGEAERVGARVVFISTAQALGVIESDSPPQYVPVDDDYTPRPVLAYGVSKLLAEELCAAFTRRSGLPSICLRPVGVFDDERAARLARVRAQPDPKWERWWELGAFVDLGDFVEAVVLATTADVTGHTRMLVCGDDCASSEPILETLARVHPGVTVRDRDSFERDPHRSLFDSATARAVLGWQPSRRWAELSARSAPGAPPAAAPHRHEGARPA